jgi:hypothetical protein
MEFSPRHTQNKHQTSLPTPPITTSVRKHLHCTSADWLVWSPSELQLKNGSNSAARASHTKTCKTRSTAGNLSPTSQPLPRPALPTAPMLPRTVRSAVHFASAPRRTANTQNSELLTRNNLEIRPRHTQNKLQTSLPTPPITALARKHLHHMSADCLAWLLARRRLKDGSNSAVRARHTKHVEHSPPRNPSPANQSFPRPASLTATTPSRMMWSAGCFISEP